jgi:hypothetical protein
MFVASTPFHISVHVLHFFLPSLISCYIWHYIRLHSENATFQPVQNVLSHRFLSKHVKIKRYALFCAYLRKSHILREERKFRVFENKKYLDWKEKEQEVGKPRIMKNFIICIISVVKSRKKWSNQNFSGITEETSGESWVYVGRQY